MPYSNTALLPMLNKLQNLLWDSRLYALLKSQLWQYSTELLIDQHTKKINDPVICRQDEELRQRDAELEQKVNELHQDNSEVKKAFRQRDQNNTLELQNVVRNSFGFRQMDFTSELKKTINQQIKEYLDGKLDELAISYDK